MVNKFAKEGVCPLCNGNNIEYGDSELEFGVGASLKCSCEDCGASWVEWYDLVFSEQRDIVADKVGEDIDELPKAEYKLTEIGYDTSFETEKSLIEVARNHCNSYDDERVEEYSPITTVKEAIRYLTDYGFTVEKLN